MEGNYKNTNINYNKYIQILSLLLTAILSDLLLLGFSTVL